MKTDIDLIRPQVWSQVPSDADETYLDEVSRGCADVVEIDLDGVEKLPIKMQVVREGDERNQVIELELKSADSCFAEYKIVKIWWHDHTAEDEAEREYLERHRWAGATS